MELAIDIWHRRAKVDSDQTIEIAAEIEMLKGNPSPSHLCSTWMHWLTKNSIGDMVCGLVDVFHGERGSHSERGTATHVASVASVGAV